MSRDHKFGEMTFEKVEKMRASFTGTDTVSGTISPQALEVDRRWYTIDTLAIILARRARHAARKQQAERTVTDIHSSPINYGMCIHSRNIESQDRNNARTKRERTLLLY